ncbi:cupin [Sulfolobales archaeon HS-7]|nr:cupin [Sulfolobales archaeon HS-7]
MYFKLKQEEVKLEQVQVPGSRDAFIQWLATRERGSTRYAVRKFTVKPDGIIAMHKHPYEEAVYVINGEAKVCVGERKEDIRQGELIYISGGEPHSFFNHSKNELEFICIIPYIEDMTITPVSGDCV